MGLFSFLLSIFNSDKEAQIERHKKTIDNFKRNIEIIKKNTANKKQAHYHESARKNIATIKYQIEKEMEKIKNLRK